MTIFICIERAYNRLLLCALFALLTGCGSCEKTPGPGGNWSAGVNGDILEIAYGSGTNYPQYAALHLNSGYLRMIYGKDAGWGTSVVIMPSFWSGGKYYQGSAMNATVDKDGADLVVKFDGSISTLAVRGSIRFSPPTDNSLKAMVKVSTSGNLALDSRPGEAFKPVMLSSMHIAPDTWDAQSAFVSHQTYSLLQIGWIVTTSVEEKIFGLHGGTSFWKKNAPTIEVELSDALPITGWVTQSADPNDDNVGFWCAADKILSSWSYTITAKSTQ